MISIRSLAFILGCLWVAGCSQAPPATATGSLSGKLVLTGSSTLAPLIGEIAAAFEQQHPGVRIEVQTGGSSRGIRDAESGAADLGMSSRELTAEELQGSAVVTLAWDGVAFVVHRSNPVQNLSNEQLKGIYTGEIDNWQQVGGTSAPIVVSNRAAGRSELTLITEYLGIEADQIQADVIDGETQQSIKTVVTNANAIVYTSIGAAQLASESGAPIRLLPLSGIAATPEAVQQGSFPLARPLILVHRSGKPDPLRDAFLAFALSSQHDSVTQKLGYVPPRRTGAMTAERTDPISHQAAQ